LITLGLRSGPHSQDLGFGCLAPKVKTKITVIVKTQSTKVTDRQTELTQLLQ